MVSNRRLHGSDYCSLPLEVNPFLLRLRSFSSGKYRRNGAHRGLQASSEAAVDVELSKRCFQVTRTVKFAKMAKKFPPDSAKTPGLRVTPPRMPKLQRAKNTGLRAHFRIRHLFLRTDFLKFKKKIPIDTFSRIRATKWRPLAARHGAMVLAGCPSAPGHPRASTLSTDGPRPSKCKFLKKTGGHTFLAAKKTKKT